MPSTNRRLVVLYLAAVAFYWTSLYLYVPTLPLYVQAKTGSVAVVGTVISMYGLWQMILRLPLGIFSDALGRRRPFIYSGFLLSALGAVVMANASGAPGLAAGRAITGMAAATWVPLVVVFGALFPPKEAVRAASILMLVNSLSRMVATGLTGWLNQLGGYSLAFYLAAGAAGLALLVLLPAKEIPIRVQPPSPGSIGRLAIRRDVLLPSLLGVVAYYANFTATFTFLPILARQYGAGDGIQSALLSGSLAIGLASNLVVFPLVRRVGARQVMLGGFCLLAAGLASAGWIGSLTGVILAQAFCGLALGFLEPALMGLSILNVIEAERATASGLYQSIYALGMFSGPWLSGKLAVVLGIPPMFLITAGGCLILGLWGSWYLPHK